MVTPAARDLRPEALWAVAVAVAVQVMLAWNVEYPSGNPASSWGDPNVEYVEW